MVALTTRSAKTAVDEVNHSRERSQNRKVTLLVLQPQVALYAEDEGKDITEAVLDAIVKASGN